MKALFGAATIPRWDKAVNPGKSGPGTTAPADHFAQLILGVPLSSWGLAHPPEEGQRSFADAVHVRAPSVVLQEEAGRRVDHVLERGAVQVAHRGLFLIKACGVVPGFDRGFDLGARRPAKPCLVAVRADWRVGRRVDAERAGVPGMEHLPAALPWRRFLRPARRCRAPVGGDEI